MEEIWKDVSKWESLYQVSNFGRVKSKRTNKILKPFLVRNGYHTVSLCNNGYQQNVLVHRLVCIAFIGDQDRLDCVNHKDGVKTNNHVSNLEWSTYTQNNRHAVETGLKNQKGENHFNSKLNDEAVKFIRENFKVISRKELAEKFKVTVSLIAMVQTYKIWKHI